MRKNLVGLGFSAIALAIISACGGGGGAGGSTDSAPQTRTLSVPVVLSDASSAEDWATIGAKVLALTLNKSDGTTVSVNLGTALPLAVNFVQLDQIGELFQNLQLTPGDVYTGSTLTLSGNPGDISLIVSADPGAGFPLAAGTVVPPSNIQIQGASGTTGSKTITVNTTFEKPFTVPSTAGSAINLDIDLSHPAFIVEHIPQAGGNPIWAVNFRNGPVKRKTVDDVTAQVLRHLYGAVTSVSTDNSSLTLDRQMPTMPVVTPETAVDTHLPVNVLADTVNKTLFYDLDAKKNSQIADFSSVSGALAAGKFVRVAARYQQNGTLVATRIWASSTFNNVWLSPEGHILHVNKASNQIVVADENGKPVTMAIDANTQFFFRAPANALADVTPIGSGTAFLQANNLARGFKVHAQVVDPLATPMVASTIDIETAAFQGAIGSVTNNGFIYTNTFNTAGDNYAQNMAFVDPTTANGKDSSGNAITGFKYWDFAYPTLVTSGASAITNFTTTTATPVSFGNKSFSAQGVSYALWGNKANTNGWAAPWVVMKPLQLPRATVSTAFASPANQFKIGIPSGNANVTVNVNTSSGSATLAYQVDKASGVVTLTQQDLTSANGLAALTSGLAAGAQVTVSGVPQTDGSIRAYVLTYYTGDQPK
ncbi:MAG: hypothetical protein HXX19_09580 [Rhodoferax sp.]|nr:hypothetical protein [Rhodoferax sp.]